MIDLQYHLQEGLVWIVNALDQVVARSSYAMGGGSVLAALWDHRHSTDIDLFYDQHTPNDVNVTRLLEYMHELELSGQVSNLQIHSTYGLMANSPHTPFSFYYTQRIFDTDALGKRERLTGIHTEKPEEILVRNIRSRMIYQPHFGARDVFDVVVGSVWDPQAMDRAFNALNGFERQTLRYMVEMKLIVVQRQDIDDLSPMPKYESLCQKEILEECLMAIFEGNPEVTSKIQSFNGSKY